MPLFEYQCLSCQTASELLVRGSEQVTCPSCGSPRVRKLLSVPARPATTAAPAPSACGPASPPGGCCGGGMCQID